MKMAVIYKYEVEMRVRDKASGKVTSVTRVEHAYSPSDALMQAAINHVSANPESEVIGSLHIGPPQDAILAAQSHDLGMAVFLKRLGDEAEPILRAAFPKKDTP